LVASHGSRQKHLDKSILALLRHKVYGGAFALLRPLIEAMIRAHVVLMGSDEEVAKIKQDTYSVAFKTIGARIDTEFLYQGLLTKLLDDARTALHSFTHSGLFQLDRRFKGNEIEPRYGDPEIIGLVIVSSSMIFLVNGLVTHYFHLEAEHKKVEELFLAWNTTISSE
jgi:hypothetical protein